MKSLPYLHAARGNVGLLNQKLEEFLLVYGS